MFRVRQFESGDVIVREDEVGESAFVIDQGRVEVLKRVRGKDVHIAYIGPGEPFGEMSLVDEKPRSATVIALEPTSVRELHRDDFMQSLQTRPEVAIRLLQVLFERLREADATILQLYRSHPEMAPTQVAETPSGGSSSGTAVRLDALTPHARHALQGSTVWITKFPFRVGRLTNDSLTHNDLSIPDQEPLQISRHHLKFVSYGRRIGIVDRGSRQGSIVNGKLLGGANGQDTILLTTPNSTLVIGNESSQYRFRVSLNS